MIDRRFKNEAVAIFGVAGTKAHGGRSRERRDSSEIYLTPETVKDRILELLDQKPPQRFTDVMNELGKPNRTVYVSLKELVKKGLVSITEHKYSLTDEGRSTLENRRRLVEFSHSLRVRPQAEASIRPPSGRNNPKSEGQWIWVPSETLETLEERSQTDKIPISAVIEAAVNPTHRPAKAKRSELANASELSKAREATE